jgi:hypothetical protein
MEYLSPEKALKAKALGVAETTLGNERRAIVDNILLEKSIHYKDSKFNLVIKPSFVLFAAVRAIELRNEQWNSQKRHN